MIKISGIFIAVFALSIMTTGTMGQNSTKEKSIILGGGCFWCIEAVFNMTDGVVSATSGYAGGQADNPTYDEVCAGTTGHAEVVQVVYDEHKVSLRQLLDIFFTIHDPSQINRQGADVGSQYRSVIYYNQAEDRKVIDEAIAALKSSGTFDRVVTEIKQGQQFYKAEVSHQDYYQRNQFAAYCSYVIKPKVRKFRKVFPDLAK
ncbi:MAG: peptide-methionine (S)-S-oxide reductase MsrA [Salinivirgaceae bacterium]|jgi:methionine-S-sulfoxide reductase|nr:peptide-methionine (S)-S-oxide reductase MsrA [Salinivirgaceae bacterium]